MTTTNTQTGLEESWHDHFKIPVVYQAGLEQIRLDGPTPAIHKVPRGGERTLDFYSQLGESAELFVSLHGAAPRGGMRYPMFRRVESMKGRVTSFLAFADPTLTFADADDFTIGWYVGGPDWDPLDDIETVVRAAQQHTGARHVMFLGGSAGGHAALRIAARFTGSLALVTDPQTSIAAYYAPHRARLIQHCWPGQEEAHVLASVQDRFDLLDLYSSLDPGNFFYYRQSTGDEWHEANHARPFQKAITSTAGARQGRFQFVYEPGERPGHGKITADEFDRHFGLAARWWRENR